MSARQAPLLVEYPRTAEAVAALINRRLAPRFGPADGDSLRRALVCIGARYGDILTEHLNAVPELHHGYFVSYVGGVPSPALPAHVLLSFKAVASRRPT